MTHQGEGGVMAVREEDGRRRGGGQAWRGWHTPGAEAARGPGRRGALRSEGLGTGGTRGRNCAHFEIEN